MNRLDRTFSRLRRDGRKALVVYLMAGDPDLKTTEQLLRFLERDGVDAVELGVPFSDPLADGPVIQAAAGRALESGVTLGKILQLVRRSRRHTRLPILLMSYLNPILHYGYDRFAEHAAAAGVDGLILPDLPLEEGREVAGPLKRHGLRLIHFLAPTSPQSRRRLIARRARGFLYYVSVTGVTGARRALEASLDQNILDIKKMGSAPVCVGFGISTPDQARQACRRADGVIVGSALVRALAGKPRRSPDAFSRCCVRPYVRAVRGVRS